MTDIILAALAAEKVGEYLIKKTVQKSAELFFIKKTLDVKRAKEFTQYEVTVYSDFEKNGKACKGQSSVNIFPGMTESEIRGLIKDAMFAASFVANPTYELPGPSDNRFIEMESDIAGNTMEENCRVMAEALFAEDNDSDAFINSAELFIYDDSKYIINSKGINAGYRKCSVSGEFVVQCKSPRDVETYKDFRYSSLNAQALRDKVKRTIEYTKARAQASEAPASGNYRLILSEDYVATLFDFYKDKADAGYVYAGYSDYKTGENVQAGEDGKIAGDAITAELKADVPFTSEGIRLIDRPFLDRGVLKTITGNARFASYLGIEPTGVYDDLSVECGTTSVEEMKKKPYLHVVNFSDFQMDSFDGHFGGEIRLAFLFDGEKVTPVTGGSVNGSWFEVQSRLTLSKEKQNDKGFEGPLAICMDDIPVAGK